jgi:hypothetical protein
VWWGQMFVAARMIAHLLLGAATGTLIAVVAQLARDACQPRPPRPTKQSPQWWVVHMTFRGSCVVPCGTRRDAERFCSSLRSNRILLDKNKGSTNIDGHVYPWRELLVYGYPFPFVNLLMRRALMCALQPTPPHPPPAAPRAHPAWATLGRTGA